MYCYQITLRSCERTLTSISPRLAFHWHDQFMNISMKRLTRKPTSGGWPNLAVATSNTAADQETNQTKHQITSVQLQEAQLLVCEKLERKVTRADNSVSSFLGRAR